MSSGESVVRLAGPSRIVRLVLDRSEQRELTIIMSLVSNGASSVTEVRFRGASDVRFRGVRTELKELVVLLVEDISSRGWEGVNLSVKDYEEEFISFVCREIDPPLPK
jgi:hypothetical protein